MKKVKLSSNHDNPPCLHNFQSKAESCPSTEECTKIWCLGSPKTNVSMMHWQGEEPRSPAWEARILMAHLSIQSILFLPAVCIILLSMTETLILPCK